LRNGCQIFEGGGDGRDRLPPPSCATSFLSKVAPQFPSFCKNFSKILNELQRIMNWIPKVMAITIALAFQNDELIAS